MKDDHIIIPTTTEPISGMFPRAKAVREPLSAKRNRWREALKHAATGPLIIAPDVVDVLENWDDYRAEVDNVSAASWVRDAFGSRRKGLDYWRRRVDAVDKFGEAIRRAWDHEVAVWLNDQTPADKVNEIKNAMHVATRSNNRMPLTEHQARRIARSILGAAKRDHVPRRCSRCEEMAEVLRRHGLPMPE